MKSRIISILLVIIISIPIGIGAYHSQYQKVETHEIDMRKYICTSSEPMEVKVLGEEPNTDFVPGYYPSESEKMNPYPDAIEKHIEATAYCYGTTTCTGKKIREGYAAMSKRYLGMTAIVYEADENGQALDYIGTYEIEDTGGDERIKNGNCIDIYIPDYDKAVEFGRKQVVVYLIEAKG